MKINEIYPDFRVFFSKWKNVIFLFVSALILLLAALSDKDDLIPKISISVIDYYLFWLLITSARLSTRDLVIDIRHKYLMQYFPGRIMGIILFLVLLVGTAYMFSCLYYSSRSEFCSHDQALKCKFDAFCLSVGTITTVSIVDFSPIRDHAKALLIWQLGNDILLFIAAFPLLLSRISNFEDRRKPNKHERLPYDANLAGAKFTKENVEQLTGYPPEKWCDFSGMFTEKNRSLNLIKKDELKLNDTYPKLKLSVYTSDIKLDFLFDLSSDLIHVSYFGVPEECQSAGVATEAFREFLKLATVAGFKNVECTARHGNKDIPLDNSATETVSHSGFYTWGRFGFTMNETKSAENKKALDNIKKFDGKIDNLNDLLSTRRGRDYWKCNGETWYGVFDLSPMSKNRTLWKKYLKEVKAKV